MKWAAVAAPGEGTPPPKWLEFCTLEDPPGPDPPPLPLAEMGAGGGRGGGSFSYIIDNGLFLICMYHARDALVSCLWTAARSEARQIFDKFSPGPPPGPKPGRFWFSS